jgi:UDP-N-acetylglucosamine:LPS N-acetylglucosamine transferase
LLKQKLISLLKDKQPVTVILEGNPGRPDKDQGNGEIRCISHLPASEMKKIVTGSESVISRSGYTTIMDLVSLNCSALLIPTPGQTEQEYLAEYLSCKGWFTAISQSELNKDLGLPPTKPAWPSSLVEESKLLLNKTLEELLK